MPTEAKARRENKVRTSVQLEPDERAWVTAQADEFKVPESHIVRQAIRAAMQAEQQARTVDGAPT
jgi:hypothetical protein